MKQQSYDLSAKSAVTVLQREASKRKPRGRVGAGHGIRREIWGLKGERP
jgi:hypothetical protein